MINAYIVLEIFTIMICIAALYNQKFRLNVSTMCVMVTNIIVMYMINEKYLEEAATLLVYAIIFIYCLIEYKGSIKLAIINNMLYFTIISLLQLISTIPLVLLQSIEGMEKYFLLIDSVCVLLCIYLFRNKLGKISLFIQAKQLLARLVLALSFIMMAMFLLKYRVSDIITAQSYVMSVIFAILAVVLTQKWNESREEIWQKQKELQMAEVYNEAVEELVLNVRRQQHDMDNHLNAIFSQHYVYKNYEELVEIQKMYCGEIKRNIKYHELLKISVPVLAGFLYSKCTEMSEKGLEVGTNVKLYSKTLPMPIYELISILGILLDNAMEAALELEAHKQKVRLDIEENDTEINVVVRNIYEYISMSQLEQLFELGYSSKGQNHGIGLNTVKNTLLKNDSIITYGNEENEGHNWVWFGFKLTKNAVSC